MLIPRNDPLCGKCLVEKNCDCLCHEKDVTWGNHYEIHEDDMTFIVKPVVDLNHFRHEGFIEWIRKSIDNIKFKLKLKRFD